MPKPILRKDVLEMKDLQPGMILKGKLGVRIEDVVILSETGCEDITLAPKELMIL